MERPYADPRHLMLAIPLTHGAPAALLRECDQLAIFQVDRQDRKVLYQSVHQAIPAEHDRLPLRLDRLGVDVVLTRSARKMSRERFEEHGIAVVQNVPSKPPSELVREYLNGEISLSKSRRT
jgi:hypothetical protein